MNELGTEPFELDALDDEIEQARDEAASAVDRVKALVELRSHALAVAEELDRPLYASDVLEPLDPRDEETRASLKSLFNRIVREEH